VADLWETASELESIARHLRLAGELELRQELLKAVTGAAREAGDEIRAALPDYLPNRYAETLDADLAIGTSTRLAGQDPSVRLIGSPRGFRRRALRRLEAGVLRHPVFGDREVWRQQADGVRAGFFSGPAEAAAPKVRAAIDRALATVSDKATRKGP
jgi:hypothetical protein